MDNEKPQKMNLVNRLNLAKKHREVVEEQAKALKNKISSLKLKEKLSCRKIEKFKALVKKIGKVKKQKNKYLQESETKRNERNQILNLQKKFNMEEALKSQRTKEENMEKYYLKNKEEGLAVKERQRFDEFLMNQEYLKKCEENVPIKQKMQMIKTVIWKEIQLVQGSKCVETQRLHNERVNEEKNILLAKHYERNMMQEVEFAVLEHLQAGNF